jgi:O-succinylbenzoic acid--CoA ligase
MRGGGSAYAAAVSSRPVLVVDPPTGRAAVATFLTRLADTLSGSGPALAVLANDPLTADLRHRLLTDPVTVPDEVAVVMATSGSTGRPTATGLGADALLASARGTHDALAGPGQWLLALPTNHVAGLQVLVRSVAAGTEPALVAPGQLTADRLLTAAAGMAADLPRYLAVVPRQLRRIVAADPAALRAMTATLVGGAAAGPVLLQQATSAGATVVATYGMTETCGGVVYDGHPLPNTTVRVDDDGRLLIAGPTLAAGWLDLQADPPWQSRVGRWWYTDDVGEVADDGRVVVRGRADDVIISGGTNVAPVLVEAAIRDLATVAEVCVVGRPDADWGSAVVAVVEPALGHRTPDVTRLRDDLRDQLPASHLPRDVVVVPQLPRLPSGKPDRTAVRNLLAADDVGT